MFRPRFLFPCSCTGSDVSDPLLVSGRRAAEITGLPYSSVMDLRYRGLLPAVQFPGSRSVWFRTSDIRQLVDQHVERSGFAPPPWDTGDATVSEAAPGKTRKNIEQNRRKFQKHTNSGLNSRKSVHAKRAPLSCARDGESRWRTGGAENIAPNEGAVPEVSPAEETA
jgi:hypothetical protein